MRNSRAVLLLASAAFLGSIVAANWALRTWGFIPVGFGLTVIIVADMMAPPPPPYIQMPSGRVEAER